MGTTIEILSVNIGRPRVLVVHNGRPIHSSIARQPVDADTLLLTSTALEGDQSTDTRVFHGHQVHGGPEKAVYAYPSEHFPLWEAELGQTFGPAPFGENLTIRGITEDEAHIGDVWRWGEATLQISMPRGPCYKLDIHRGVPELKARMQANGRSGWYLRVLQPGVVPVRGPIEVIERHTDLTVRTAFDAMYDPGAVRARAAARDVDLLSAPWRRGIEPN
jgi:MOSC domain-containing protein YiiM